MCFWKCAVKAEECNAPALVLRVERASPRQQSPSSFPTPSSMVFLRCLMLSWLLQSTGFLIPPRRWTSVVRDLSQSSIPSSEVEFSRIVNSAQVTERRPVLCKIIAKEHERVALAERLDVYRIPYLAANITITRKDQASILVEGVLAAQIKDGEELDPYDVNCDFDTLVLDNSSGAGISFEEATDYDDEIGPSGDLDIGEITAQYLSMELF